MMAKQEKARRLSNIEDPRAFKGKVFKQKQQQQQLKRKTTESEDGEKRPRLSKPTSPAAFNNNQRKRFYKQKDFKSGLHLLVPVNVHMGWLFQ